MPISGLSILFQWYIFQILSNFPHPNHHHYYQSPSFSIFFQNILIYSWTFFSQTNFRISVPSSFYFTLTHYFFNILPLCRSKFLTYIIFLPSRRTSSNISCLKRSTGNKFPEFLSEKVSISLSLLKEILQGKKF